MEPELPREAYGSIFAGIDRTIDTIARGTVMSAKKTVFHSAEDAAKYADAKNGEPLPDGKEKRTPFKVYKLWNSYVERYAVAQNPMSALHASHTEFGINVESIGGEKLMPMDEYFSRLTPEQLAEARKYLGNDA